MLSSSETVIWEKILPGIVVSKTWILNKPSRKILPSFPGTTKP